MEQLDKNTYRCTFCDAIIEIPPGQLQLVLAGASGIENERAVTVSGVEVHRCVLSRANGPVELSRIYV